jgi:hypothetical protein
MEAKSNVQKQAHMIIKLIDNRPILFLPHSAHSSLMDCKNYSIQTNSSRIISAIFTDLSMDKVKC